MACTRCIGARTVLVFVLASVSACSSLRPWRGDPEPIADSSAETEAPTPATAAAEAPPELNTPVERQIVSHGPVSPQVLVLLSSSIKNYADVAATLQRSLEDRYRLYVKDLSQATDRDVAFMKSLPAWNGVIAIGASATEFARQELPAPTVFCQIFDYEGLLEQDSTLFGVEALPPLDVQMRSWKRIAADAEVVGLIVGEDDESLVETARAAAMNAGLELRHAFARTDREAVYQFKRIAQAVDGILLYPSRDILSPSAIQEILDYSSKHGVHSIVFDEALLLRGALLSVGSDVDDVATTVARVVDRVVAGDTDALERVTPLTRADVKMNAGMLGPLGVVAASTDQLTQ